jgi:hypothetical protein
MRLYYKCEAITESIDRWLLNPSLTAEELDAG